MMFIEVKNWFICAIFYTCIKVSDQAQLCTGTFRGTIQEKYCEIGGCCVPSDENEYSDLDDLCCISELTIILVSTFVGGPLLILILVVFACAVKKYLEKRQKRREETLHTSEHGRHRRRRRHSRNEEEMENNNLPKPTNGYLNGAPPYYHGLPNLPGYNEDQLNNSDSTNEVTLPLSPPPSYALAIASKESNSDSNVPSTSGRGNHTTEVENSDRQFHRPRQGVTDSPTEELELYNTIPIGGRRTVQVNRGRQPGQDRLPGQEHQANRHNSQREEAQTGNVSIRSSTRIKTSTTRENQSENRFHVPHQSVTSAPAEEPDLLLYI